MISVAQRERRERERERENGRRMNRYPKKFWSFMVFTFKVARDYCVSKNNLQINRHDMRLTGIKSKRKVNFLDLFTEMFLLLAFRSTN